MPREHRRQIIEVAERITDHDVLEKFEEKYWILIAKRKEAATAQRKAMAAAAQAAQAGAAAAERENMFFLELSEHIEEVALEPLWEVYKRNEGNTSKLTIEAMITRRDQRNALRAATNQARQAAADPSRHSGLFGDGSDGDEPDESDN